MNAATLRAQLELPYDLERWRGLLPELLPGVELFTKPQVVPLTSDAQKALATRRRQFGRSRVRDAQGNERVIAFFEVEVKPNVQLTRNRVSLRQIVATCIDEATAHAVLAFFVQPGSDSYRLTYAARESRLDEAAAVRSEETAAKRFTYVLGPGVPCRTAADRLAGLGHDPAAVTLTKVTDAFSVEKLSDEFFEQYRKVHYAAFCQHLIDATAPADIFGIKLRGLQGKERDKALKPVRDFVKKLLGRLVFLHFLQKKGWLGCPPDRTDWTDGDPQFLKNLFAACRDPDRFHSQALVPLFFDTLNNPDRKQSLFKLPRISYPASRIPYLNGGLFERDFDAVDQIDFPAPLFAALLDFFGQYNFTIDENDPDDHEIGIDPEMLGHIFENLLEDNKDKGAYYTPKPVVQYMCQQSLIYYLQSRLGKGSDAGSGIHDTGKTEASHPASRTSDPVSRISDLERLVRTKTPIDPKDKSSWLAQNARVIEQALDDVKICDPAIGSGAFPIGLLQEIYWTKLTLHPAMDRAKAKRDIIQKSIHGVDIDAGAVEIARLRCWLALIVEEDQPRPLPNLDFKIMQGDSLLESFRGIDLSRIMESRDRRHVRIVQSEMELTGIASAQELEFEFGVEEQRALADQLRSYFDARDPVDKARRHREIDSLVRKRLDTIVSNRQTALESDERNYRASIKKAKSEHRNRDVTRLEKTLSALQVALQKLARDRADLLVMDKRPERPFFLWRLFFQDVFAQGGFDIVIGNPPYVRADNPDFAEARARIMAEGNYQTLWEKWDLFIPFIEQGFRILRPGGIEVMIVSDAYCHAKYAIKSQDWFLQNSSILRIDFCGELQMFDAAVRNVIFFYQASDGRNNRPIRRWHERVFGQTRELSSDIQDNLTHRVFFPEYEQKDSSRDGSISLGAICYITIGMVVNAHEKLAPGLFTMDDLVVDQQDQKHPKRFVEGKHLDKWLPATHRWLEWGTKRAPALFRRKTFPEIYEVDEKILVQRSPGPDPKCCYDNQHLHFTESTVAFIPWHSLSDVRNRSLSKAARYDDEKPSPDLPRREDLEETSRRFQAKYLVAVMNSSIARDHLMRNRRSNIHLYPEDWKTLPIPDVDTQTQSQITTLVDRLLAAKRSGDLATAEALDRDIDLNVTRLYGLDVLNPNQITEYLKENTNVITAETSFNV